MENKATVLGVMSGSSLDGLDSCLVELEKSSNGWSFQIEAAKTFELPDSLKIKLSQSAILPAKDLLSLDIEYGEWISNQIRETALSADLIALHGHTVFHSPSGKISLQIGSGEVVQLRTQKPVVANFRNKDILFGGQGAPLVPMGEKLLFPEYDGFLNLGGICNASFNNSGNWIAGDIGPFNQVFNFYSEMLGQTMDTNGAFARSGNLLPDLIETWSEIAYFNEHFPKSLANQWVSSHFLEKDHDPKNAMHSFAAFISDQIALSLNKYGANKTMVTGGGAKNKYLMELLHAKCHNELIIPDEKLVDYKEALIFALLGLLRFRGEENVLSSCTGASHNSSSGIIYER